MKRASRAPPAFVEPMKALGVPAVPDGRWRLEIKFDGYRAIAVIARRKAQLWSRNHRPLTGDYPEVVESLRRLSCREAVLDGEIVALDAAGQSRFQLLQRRAAGGPRPNIVYYVFDLLQVDGRNMASAPLEERQKLLERLVPRTGGSVRLSPVFDVPPAKLLTEVRRRGLEGIVAKASGSIYEPGRRSGAWVKCRIANQQEFVIGGHTPPAGSRAHFGALLLGYYERGKLAYAGNVGTGFDRAALAAVHARLARLRRADSPFASGDPLAGNRWRPASKSVTWAEPKLVAQIKFSEWTSDGRLRHPVFLGLREDKKAKDVVRETSSESSSH